MSFAPLRIRARRIQEAGQEHLAQLAAAWKYPPVAHIEIVLNPSLRSTLARWSPGANVIELNLKLKARRPRMLREVIAHEAAHVVVFDRFFHDARPHGPEWAELMRVIGYEPRATLVKCGYRRPRHNARRVRHFCPICHFSRFAKRRMGAWRCPECRAIGLEGVLEIERVPIR
jgi:predicted SprT family Zn-dependent metalloprotease